MLPFVPSPGCAPRGGLGLALLGSQLWVALLQQGARARGPAEAPSHPSHNVWGWPARPVGRAASGRPGSCGPGLPAAGGRPQRGLPPLPRWAAGAPAAGRQRGGDRGGGWESGPREDFGSRCGTNSTNSLLSSATPCAWKLQIAMTPEKQVLHALRYLKIKSRWVDMWGERAAVHGSSFVIWVRLGPVRSRRNRGVRQAADQGRIWPPPLLRWDFLLLWSLSAAPLFPRRRSSFLLKV